MNRYWLIALVAPALWGTTYGVTQRWLAGVDPLWLAALRSLIPGLCLLPLVPMRLWKQRWRDILVLSVFNISLFTLLLFMAISRLPGGVAATLVSTMPLQILLLFWLSGRAPGGARLLAALGGVAGVALLVWQAPQQLDWVGVVLALLAASCLALGGLLVPRIGRGMPPLQMVAAQFQVAGLMLAVLAYALTGSFPDVTLERTLAMIWIGPLGMGLGYVCWFFALTVLPVDKMSFLGLLNPLVAVLLGLYLMDEHLTVLQLMGMVLVSGCVLLAQRGGRASGETTAAANAVVHKVGTEAASVRL